MTVSLSHAHILIGLHTILKAKGIS